MIALLLLAQAETPFFSNDQWGLLKVIVVIVGPIAALLWGLERRKERHDITELGRKLDKDIVPKITMLEAQVATITAQMSADRIATITAINDARTEMTETINKVGLQVASLTEAIRITNDLRKILREERGS